MLMPTSKGLTTIAVGQSLKTICAAGISFIILYSRAGVMLKLHAIILKNLTFLATNSFPVNFEKLSAGVFKRRARLVEKPIEIIITELSGAAHNSFLYNFVDSITSV